MMIIFLFFLVCFDTLFSKEGLLKNVGFYIFIMIIVYHLINALIFIIKKYDLIIIKIMDIVYAKKK
jgi:hypothetical protein